MKFAVNHRRDWHYGILAILINLLALPAIAAEQNATFSLSAEEKAWLAQHPEIRVGMMDTWAPFDFVDKSGRPSGIGVDYVAALNKRLGGVLKLVPGAWKDIYDGVREKRLDALLDITPKPEREAFFNFTTPYLDVPHVIVAPKGIPFLNNEDDLKGKSLALEQGFGNVDYFRENYPDITIREYRDTSHALGAVARGEADAYAGNRGVALYLMAQEVMPNLKVHGRLGKAGSILAIGTRKDWPMLRDILQRALDDISPNERQVLLNRWVALPDESPVQLPLKLTEQELLWLKEHPVLRIGVDAGYAPYAFVDSQGKFQGVAADFAETISEMLGIQMQMVPGLSWPEIIQASKDKTIDIITTASYRPEREGFLNFTEGYIPTPLVIMSRVDDERIKERGDIAKRKVALVDGYSSSQSVLQEFSGLDVVYVGTPLEGLRAVSIGEADAYVGVLGINIYQAQRSGIANLRVAAPYDLEVNTQRYGVRKDWPILATILDKALKAIPEERVNRIFQKWIPIDQPLTPSVDAKLTAEEKAWLESHPVVRVGFSQNWAPIEFLDEDGDFQGISSEYIKRLEKLLGVKFEMAKELSWQESIAAVKRGEIDMFPSIRETPERQEFLGFTDSYTRYPIALYSGPDVSYIGGMELLHGRKVGVVKGFAINELLATNHPEIELVPVSNVVEALEMLSRGETDAYAGNILVTGYYLAQLGYTHIKVVGETPYHYEQSMGVRKDWSIFLSILKKALSTISPAERTSISNRWVGVRYEKGFDYTLIWKLLVGFALLLLAFTYWNRRLAHEVHERQQAEKELYEANERLKELDKLKSMFIASMSHELRTPLNSIIGFTGMMLQGISGELNEEQKDNLNRVYRSGEHLLDLISDVIDISKIEAGRVEMFPQRFALKEVVDEAVALIQPQAEKKRLSLEVVAASWPKMFTDRKRLLQCLLNYLSNAVKFTEQGSVTVLIQELNGDVEIAVTDTGIGIAKEDMAKLFEAFERLETHLRVKAGGSGLGLYLTRKITHDLLQGEVRVTSEVNRGSTFSIRIPREVSIPANQEER